MSEHTPLTEAERDDFRRQLRQNLGYRAWVIEDTMLGHVERILAARTSTATADTDRCKATFPCHPTPEYPCDNPGGDHRCALDLDHHGEHVTPGGWR